MTKAYIRCTSGRNVNLTGTLKVRKMHLHIQPHKYLSQKHTLKQSTVRCEAPEQSMHFLPALSYG